MEESQLHELNIIFLPFPAPGHMNPMVDIARLFAKHGVNVNVSIITTTANSLIFQEAIDTDFNSGLHIRTKVLPFPSSQVGLPNGIENLKDCTSSDMMNKIDRGMSMLKDQIELLLFQDLQPDCIVTDMLFPWTRDSAAKLGIPRICFYSSSYFSYYASYFMYNHKPHDHDHDHESLVSIPGFPDTISLKALQLAEHVRNKPFPASYIDAIYESERKSYGSLYNSFHELESDYEKLYKNTIGIKSWSVGPVSTWVNKEKTYREKTIAEEEPPEWLNWLNSKQNESVLYVSFGSLVRLPYAQLVELAHGLENSGHELIWVIIRREKDGYEDHREVSFLKDFEQRMKRSNKGYVTWNWAPQLVILDHPAIGGIVTHCGWNSIIESLNANLPMITWPVLAEQFYNEMLLTRVLKIAVPVVEPTKENINRFWEENAMVKREEISKAVMLLMGIEEESKEMRKRVRMLCDAAKKSVEGGSSFNNLLQFIDELKSLKMSRILEKKQIG